MAKPEKCGNCHKPATIHLTQIVNGQIHKVDLCEECPYKKTLVDPEAFSLADFLLKPAAEDAVATGPAIECPSCGFKPANFKKKGRFGCPDCYRTFHDMLVPMLANMHRDVTHRGKIPHFSESRNNLLQRIRALESDLQRSIKHEHYEDAARLRDEIRDLQQSLHSLPVAP
jgi:protein arginine kinase activator